MQYRGSNCGPAPKADPADVCYKHLESLRKSNGRRVTTGAGRGPVSSRNCSARSECCAPTKGAIFKDELQIGHVMLIDSTIYGRFDICEPLRPPCVRCEDRWNLRPRVPVLGTSRDHSSRTLRRDHPPARGSMDIRPHVISHGSSTALVDRPDEFRDLFGLTLAG
jgi:hypothetical protein